MRVRLLLCVTACCVLTTGLGSAKSARGSLALESCRPAKGIDEAWCGKVSVPENYDQPQGRQITLNVVLLPSTPGGRRGTPLFDLAGGPGLAATGAAIFYATDGRDYRLQGDIVLVDQRGTGKSAPLLCPELESRPAGSRMYPPSAVRQCRANLAATADLSQYTTRNAALDLDAVREALDYPKINLLGLSYGTRLAQAYVALRPERVHAAVLIGATTHDAKLPLWHARHAQETLDALFDDCRHDPACARTFPDLGERWHKALSLLDGPIRTTANANAVVERGALLERFRTLLATTSSQRRVPAIIDRLSRGDFAPLLSPAGANGIAEGLYLSVTCAEDTQWITAAERLSATAGTFLGTYRIDEQADACREWQVPRSRIPATDSHSVPTLLLAGDRDYVTPVRWARQVAGNARAARVVVIPGLGHFPDGLTHLECLDRMIRQFLGGPTQAFDDSCIATMQPPHFEMPAANTDTP
jgi:pimeloyl-ACP methyl ester carboxylesterase